VYLRTYSVLILMEIVAFDNANPFLDQADLDGFLEAALGYLLRERDLRSWVPGPGWANAVGHTADLLMMLARSPHLGVTELQRILDAIADRLLTPAPVVFVHHEDERLAYATLNVLRRNLIDRTWLVAWLDRFTAAPGQESWRSAYASEAESAARANVTAFLRSLYFQLILTESPPPDAQRSPTPSWSPSAGPTSASTTWPDGRGRRPGRRPAQPQRRLGRLHRLVDHGQQLGGQGVQVDLVAQAGREPLDGAGGVVAAAVEAPVDQVLDAAPGGLEQRGHGQGGPRPPPSSAAGPPGRPTAARRPGPGRRRSRPAGR
jgi:hypothetical protein